MFYTGKEIGPYKLVRILGRGGFGEVWLAEKQAKFVTTKVAVKLPLENQVDAESIKEEAVLWEQASGHPNVLPILDADEYNGQVVVVSEYAPDGTLDDLLVREGAMPFKKASETAAGILSGLEFLHNKGIIHRDIKPQNILLQGETPRLADFGMSRAMRTGGSTSVNINGTPCYMAPEAFSRKRNAQTDIWSVGIVLYKMLTGKLPFRSENLVDLMSEVLVTKPDPLPGYIPERLGQIVAKALAKLPQNRYETAGEMREDLLNLLAAASYENVAPYQQKADTAGKGALRQTAPGIARPTPRNLSYSFLDSEELIERISLERKPIAEELIETDLSQPSEKSTGKRKFSKRLYLFCAAIILTLIVFSAGGYIFFFSAPALIPFRKGDKFGFCDPRKRLFIGARYDLAKPFSEKLAVVAAGFRDENKNFKGKYGFIDRLGREIIPLEYDYAEDFSQGLAKVGRFDKARGKMLTGFIDSSGAEIIPFRYDDALNFSVDELAAVKTGDKWGFIDKTGKEIIPPKYDSVKNFSNHLAAVELNGKYGFIDPTGAEIISPDYDFAGNFSEGVAPVKKGGKAFFIDARGNQSLPFKYSDAEDFSEGFALVTINGKSGFIDKSGIEAIPLAYEDESSGFSDGFAGVELNGRKGFIDKSGKQLIDFKYRRAEQFHKGLARVENSEGKEFYIRFDGTEYYEP